MNNARLSHGSWNTVPFLPRTSIPLSTSFFFCCGWTGVCVCRLNVICVIARSGVCHSIGWANWTGTSLEMFQMQMKSKKFFLRFLRFLSFFPFFGGKNSFYKAFSICYYISWHHINGYPMQAAQSTKRANMPYDIPLSTNIAYIRYEFVSCRWIGIGEWREDGKVAQANNCKMEWRVIKI